MNRIPPPRSTPPPPGGRRGARALHPSPAPAALKALVLLAAALCLGVRLAALAG
jgi:hypothetical protein